MAQQLTPKQVRDKLKERGYDLSQHANPMASVHGILKSIRVNGSQSKGTLSATIREILREAEEL